LQLLKQEACIQGQLAKLVLFYLALENNASKCNTLLSNYTRLVILTQFLPSNYPLKIQNHLLLYFYHDVLYAKINNYGFI